MENPLCSNENVSSAPVPYVGLYIAGTTLVCLLLILCDLFLCFRRKRPYLPCKFFSINSATLTLLAVVSKLPVDLTTNMPSASDQISKLTGTIMVCVSMAFMMPSIGTNRKAESISNMIALSLFVVTIVVNICIQLRTGVIFSFFWEHILISCFMLIMLAVFWHSTNNINAAKIRLAENNRLAFTNNVAHSSIDKVKPWYKSSSVSNPQFLLCKDVLASTSSGMICIICLAVLAQATYRSLVVHKVKFCNEDDSDYGWSIPMILVTQIISIVVASVATTYRWFMMVIHEEFPQTQLHIYMYIKDTETLAFKFLAKYKKCPMKKISMTYASLGLFKSMVSLVCVLVFFTIVSIPFYLWRFILHGTRSLKGRSTESSSSSTIGSTSRLNKKIERICEKEMNIWMDATSNTNPPNCLVEVLRRRNPDFGHYRAISFHFTGFRLSEGFYKLSCLSLVIFARAMTLLMPSDRANPLTQALDEAFELLYYIDQKTNAGDSEDEMKREMAKVILENNKGLNNISDFDNAVLRIEDDYEFFRYSKPAKFEMEIIKKVLEDYNSRRSHAMYMHLEEAFISSLYQFLYKFPDAVIKDVNESPIEEHEERARVVSKLVCKYKILDDVLNYGDRMTPWEQS